MLTKYVLIEWPDCQYLVNSNRFNECYLVDGNAYMCPEDLWEDIKNKIKN